MHYTPLSLQEYPAEARQRAQLMETILRFLFGLGAVFFSGKTQDRNRNDVVTGRKELGFQR
jgi:hypothetical protein